METARRAVVTTMPLPTPSAPMPVAPSNPPDPQPVGNGGWLRKLRKALRLIRTLRYRNALLHGVAAGIEHTAALTHIRAHTVVDVGANRGQFALLALELFPDAHVHAFEPLAKPRAQLARWAKAERRLSVHPLALGSCNGAASMIVAARDDNSSLRPITDRQMALFPGTHAVGREQIRVARLDSVLRAEALSAPALLKIDVQGSELEVLHGAADLLARFDWVYVECSYVELYEGQAMCNEIVAVLEAAGFALERVCNLVHDKAGQPLQGDFLFARRSKPDEHACRTEAERPHEVPVPQGT